MRRVIYFLGTGPLSLVNGPVPRNRNRFFIQACQLKNMEVKKIKRFDSSGSSNSVAVKSDYLSGITRETAFRMTTIEPEPPDV
jgi:hypothetical protein